MRKTVTIICVLALMLTMFPVAYAASGPSKADLEAIKSGIEYPKTKEYWDDYGYGTVNAPKGHSVYCYGSADMNGSKYTVKHGAEVTVLASRGQMLCVIIPSLKKARWIRSANVDLYVDGRDTQSESIDYYPAGGSPSKADLEAIKSGIEYPKSKEYWDEYVYGTVNAPKGHSVYCYGSADMLGSKYTVKHGVEVVVLASRGQMLCVIIPSLKKARWIRSANVDLD